MAERSMATRDNVALLMVSGGSDSTALAYLAADAVAAGRLGGLAMLHVNHHLRGAASDGDAAFVGVLAESLGIPLFVCDIDVAQLVRSSGGNMEAIARAERYRAAREALESTCLHMGFPFEGGAHLHCAHGRRPRREFLYALDCGNGPWRIPFDGP